MPSCERNTLCMPKNEARSLQLVPLCPGWGWVSLPDGLGFGTARKTPKLDERFETD